MHAVMRGLPQMKQTLIPNGNYPFNNYKRMNTKKLAPMILASLAILLIGGLSSCKNSALDAPVALNSSNTTLVANDATIIGSLESDRLALIDLYQALGGEEWFKSSGWLSETPVAEWEGVSVAEVAGQPRVVALYLGANNLQGELPQSIGKLTALKALHLQYNSGIKGEITDGIYDLKSLRSLRLGYTSLTGLLSDKIGQLAQLDTLDLRTSPYELTCTWDGNMESAKDHKPNNYRLTGELPKTIGALKSLTVLDLSHQNLSGELPSSVGDLANLKYLALYGCNFSGVLPESLGSLGQLEYLSLGDNHFTGNIPASIGQLTSLKELWMSNNRLSGEIPSSLGQLEHLLQLSLERNELTGEIPTSLTKLRNLHTLYLGSNRLSGTIPSRLAGAEQPELFWVDLSNNNLSGQLPERVQKKGGDYTIYVVSGNRLTGSVAEAYLAFPKTLKHLLPQQEGYGFDNLK